MNSFLAIVLIVLFGYALICLLMYILQERLIFFPEALPEDYDFDLPQDLDAEEIWLDRPDGKIHGLLFLPPGAQQIVLYFHGNGGAMPEWIYVASRFLERGYGVFIMDYRGYGKSQGAISQEVLLEDAQAAFDYLSQHYPNAEVSVFGRSLGSGFATYVAAHNEVARLMLETPYYSIARVAARRFPWLPVKQLIRYPMPSYRYLKQVVCPVFLIHGTQDSVIPHENSQDLLTLIGSPKAYYVEIPGGTHNDLDTYPAYYQWLDRALTYSQTPSTI